MLPPRHKDCAEELLKVPAGQAVHVAAAADATPAGAKKPAPQGVPWQAVLPTEAAQVPATHCVQAVAVAAPAMPKEPVAHTAPRQIDAPLAGW